MLCVFVTDKGHGELDWFFPGVTRLITLGGNWIGAVLLPSVRVLHAQGSPELCPIGTCHLIKGLSSHYLAQLLTLPWHQICEVC